MFISARSDLASIFDTHFDPKRYLLSWIGYEHKPKRNCYLTRVLSIGGILVLVVNSSLHGNSRSLQRLNFSEGAFLLVNNFLSVDH